MMQTIKNPAFILGALFLFGLLALSAYHYVGLNGDIPRTGILYDEDKNAIGAPPYAPSSSSWFGTDRLGNDIFYRIISGAKYTLGIAFGVATLRILISLLIGNWFSYVSSKIRFLYDSGSESFRFIPATLICYFILYPINVSNGFSVAEKVLFQLVVMTLVTVPTLSQVFTDEFGEIHRKEFVVASKMIGGKKIHVFRKHIFPLFKKRLAVIYLQQVVQTLILLAHLGLLQVFLGGTDFATLFNNEPKLALSETNEWSGLIGAYFYQLPLSPWLLLFPVGFFALTILSLNLIIVGLNNPKPMLSKKKESPLEEVSLIHAEKDNDFVFINHQTNKERYS